MLISLNNTRCKHIKLVVTSNMLYLYFNEKLSDAYNICRGEDIKLTFNKEKLLTRLIIEDRDCFGGRNRSIDIVSLSICFLTLRGACYDNVRFIDSKINVLEHFGGYIWLDNTEIIDIFSSCISEMVNRVSDYC